MTNKSDLRSLTGIGTNTLAKLSKNQVVSIEVLMKICASLNCNIRIFVNSYMKEMK